MSQPDDLIQPPSILPISVKKSEICSYFLNGRKPMACDTLTRERKTSSSTSISYSKGSRRRVLFARTVRDKIRKNEVRIAAADVNFSLFGKWVSAWKL